MPCRHEVPSRPLNGGLRRGRSRVSAVTVAGRGMRNHPEAAVIMLWSYQAQPQRSARPYALTSPTAKVVLTSSDSSFLSDQCCTPTGGPVVNG